MILQEAASTYCAEITASNEYLIKYHALLVQKITGLLQDHSISPVAMK